MIFKKGQLIDCKNFEVSIGIYDPKEVAIFSKKTGDFVKINKSNLKRSKKLRKIKRVFKYWLNSNNTFTFSFMNDLRTQQLINELKK